MVCVDLFVLGLIFVRAALAISSYQAYMNKSDVLTVGEQNCEAEPVRRTADSSVTKCPQHPNIRLHANNGCDIISSCQFYPSSNDNNIASDSYDDSLPDCSLPWSCTDVKKCGNTKSGVYQIFPFGFGKGFLVYCDLVTDDGGWLVFQRRQDGSVDFYRTWEEYKDGFGNLYGEFWLGLDKLHLLTSQYHTELRVDLVKFDGRSGFAKYSRFFVSDEQQKYRLLVGTCTGNIGDSLEYHNSRPFSTFDRDNNHWTVNCAIRDHGAWWYHQCITSNLNGEYVYKYGTPSSAYSSISWSKWGNNFEPLQFTEMKIRPVQIS